MSIAGITSELKRQLTIAEAVLADSPPFRVSMELFQDFVYLSQFQNEATFDYFQRLKFYVDEFPNYGLPFRELLNHFLYGMLPEERYELDYMAGGSVMDCTLIEMWCLINERVESTRPYVENNSLRELELAVEELSKSMEKYAKNEEENFGEHKENLKPTSLCYADSHVEPSKFSVKSTESVSIIQEDVAYDAESGEVQRFDHFVPNSSINSIATFDQVKEKQTGVNKKPPRRRKRKRNKKKKNRVIANVATVWNEREIIHRSVPHILTNPTGSLLTQKNVTKKRLLRAS